MDRVWILDRDDDENEGYEDEDEIGLQKNPAAGRHTPYIWLDLEDTVNGLHRMPRLNEDDSDRDDERVILIAMQDPPMSQSH